MIPTTTIRSKSMMEIWRKSPHSSFDLSMTSKGSFFHGEPVTLQYGKNTLFQERPSHSNEAINTWHFNRDPHPMDAWANENVTTYQINTCLSCQSVYQQRDVFSREFPQRMCVDVNTVPKGLRLSVFFWYSWWIVLFRNQLYNEKSLYSIRRCLFRLFELKLFDYDSCFTHINGVHRAKNIWIHACKSVTYRVTCLPELEIYWWLTDKFHSMDTSEVDNREREHWIYQTITREKIFLP